MLSDNTFHRNESFKEEINDLRKEIDAYIASVDAYLADEEAFIDFALSEKVKEECDRLSEQIDKLTIFDILANKLDVKKRTLESYSHNIEEWISGHNDDVAANYIERTKTIIGKVENHDLDDQQLKCIVKPARNHLVIAGAGTGKTTTIIGKVKYLLNSGICEAKDILVLSYTHDSAAEIANRIKAETGQSIDVSTFHKVGYEIIRTVDGIPPKVYSKGVKQFVLRQMGDMTKDIDYVSLLNRYFLNNFIYDRSEFDFQDEYEFGAYLRANPAMTLKGDEVKSYGEMDIANFLYQNGIAYEYEKEYEHETRTKDRSAYYPDFYLPDYGIYIEYFGINEKGEVPSYFVSRDGMSPSETYRVGMEWKRKLHAENKTTLIECFSYERSQGKLLPKLEEKLKAAGVEFNEVPAEKIWNKIEKTYSDCVVYALAELIATVISLMKNNEYDVDRLREAYGEKRNTTLVELIEPVYDAYCKYLADNDEIDFSDMLNNATSMISEGMFVNPYKYVIVDEYQDISKSQYKLLKTLRDSSDYNLFCVGDDWQSIYRFAGSDLDYILNFSKHWGFFELSRIETTYRFSESMAEISGNFITKNPIQIKKEIKGIPDKVGFVLGRIKGYTEKNSVDFMINRLRELPANSSVFFVGRYNQDSFLLNNCKALKCRINPITKIAEVVLPERPDLEMSFITAHKSKGLQADYVFILNNKSRGMGFPSKIQDDPLVNYLLGETEAFPFAEERRLFYVALTRARIKTYLLEIPGNESVFVTELEKKYGHLIDGEGYTCPWCGAPLRKETDSEGEFFGCTNFYVNGCRFWRRISRKNV